MSVKYAERDGFSEECLRGAGLYPRQTSRKKRCDDFLEKNSVQSVVALVLTFDLLVLASLVLVDYGVIRVPSSECTCTEQDKKVLRNLEAILHLVHICVISIFLLEVIVRLCTKSHCIFGDRFLVFDAAVTLTSFAVYVALTVLLQHRRYTYLTAFVIALRYNRIFKIYQNQNAENSRMISGSALSQMKILKYAEEKYTKLKEEIATLTLENEMLKVNQLSLVCETDIKNKNQLYESNYKQIFTANTGKPMFQARNLLPNNGQQATVVDVRQPGFCEDKLDDNIHAGGRGVNDSAKLFTGQISLPTGNQTQLQFQEVKRRSAINPCMTRAKSDSTLFDVADPPLRSSKSTEFVRIGVVVTTTSTPTSNDIFHDIKVQSRDGAYTNLAFTQENIEKSEICRVSKVPYLPIETVLKKNIPMTDL